MEQDLKAELSQNTVSAFLPQQLTADIVQKSDLVNIAYYFGDEQVKHLKTDDNGNEYDLEIIVRRKSLAKKEAA